MRVSIKSTAQLDQSFHDTIWDLEGEKNLKKMNDPVDPVDPEKGGEGKQLEMNCWWLSHNNVDDYLHGVIYVMRSGGILCSFIYMLCLYYVNGVGQHTGI